MEIFSTPKSRFWVYKNFTPDYYNELGNLEVYEEPPIVIYGKVCHQRRDVGFYSNESQGYKYSGTLMPSFKLENPLLIKLLDQVNSYLETQYNGILINRYKNGEKYLSAHSDSEVGLSGNVVAGIAYGEVRKFRIRDKLTKKIVLDYDHEPGELIVMDGAFQEEFTHEIPIQKKVKGERISLTFRQHKIDFQSEKHE